MSNQSNKDQPIKITMPTGNDKNEKKEEAKSSALPIPTVNLGDKPAEIVIGTEAPREPAKVTQAKPKAEVVETLNRSEAIRAEMSSYRMRYLEATTPDKKAALHQSLYTSWMNLLKNKDTNQFRRDWTVMLAYCREYSDFFTEVNLLSSMYEWQLNQRAFKAYSALVMMVTAGIANPNPAYVFSLYDSKELLNRVAQRNADIERNMINFYGG